MEDFDLHIVARKSVKGIFALVTRTFFIQLLAIAANLILAAFLSLEHFGVFFVVSSIVVFLNYFQDIGLAASLIQKKTEPTLAEYRTTFTFQQGLVFLLVIPLLLLSPLISSFYNLNQEGTALFIALLISFFLSSLRTIPTVILERRLDFQKLVIPQIVENIVYFTSLIVFSIMGYGLTTFTIAVFARGVSGLLVLYFLSPWKIGIAFDKKSFKSLVSFGVPFQANSILALVKDDLLNLYIGKVLPLSQVGFVGFSQKWAFMPLRLIMDNVIKITFPSFSRLQHDKAGLRLAIEKSLFLVSFFIFPTAIGIILLSPFFFEFVPKYEKWNGALVSLGLFSFQTVFSGISTPLTNFLNAIGKVKITLAFMIFWTAATWLFTILFLQGYGYNGVALASLVVSVSSIGVILVARRYVAFSILRPIFRQLLASLLMGVFIFLTQGIIQNLILLFVEVFFAGVFYCLVIFFLAQKELLKTLVFVRDTIRSR